MTTKPSKQQPGSLGGEFTAVLRQFWRKAVQPFGDNSTSRKSRSRLRRSRLESLESRILLTVGPFFGTTEIDSVDHVLDVRKIVAADLNKDGFQDLVSVSAGDGRLSVFTNDGLGGFSQSFLTRNSAATSLEVVDLDQDGWLDVLDYQKNEGAAGYSIYLYPSVGGNGVSVGNALISVPSEVTDLKSADMDGDGDIDLIAAFQYENTVAWYENDGSEHFTSHVIATNESLVGTIAIGDMDGDSNPDIVYGAFGDNAISILRNNGNKTFTKHSVSTSASGVASVAIADIDHDGDNDIVSANQNSDSVDWYANNGNFSYSAHLINNQVVGASSVAVGDIDKDGDIDVASIGYDGKAAWHENNGTGSFTEHDLTNNASGALSIIIADLDADSENDIVFAAKENSEIGWFQNDGTENFVERWISYGQDSLDGVRSLTVGDLDRDGDEDVITASFDSGSLLWQDNDGSGAFQTHVLATNLFGLVDVSMDDIDRDGDQDLVIVRSDVDMQAQTATTIVSWFENDGSNNFSIHQLGQTFYTTSGETDAVIKTADMDGDGDRDIVVAIPGAGKLIWYRNNGAQSFMELTISAGSFIDDLNVVDLDRDGDADIVAVGPAGKLDWFQNLGHGAFSVQTLATNLPGVGLVVAADFDHDGDIDLFAHSQATGTTWVLWNSNNIFTKSVVDSGSPDFARTMTIADFDSDGDADVLLGQDVYIYDAGQFIRTASPGDSISAAGDFDSDGDADVVYYSNFSEKLEWVQNRSINSSVVFPVAHDLPTDVYNTLAGSPEDIDKDGDLDFITIQDISLNDSWHAVLVWWENDGSGNFSSHTVGELPYSSSGSVAREATIFDVDGDGDVDVVDASDIDIYVGDEYSGHSGKIVWFQNNGAGVFSDAVLIKNYDDGLVQDLKHADLNGDGNEDLIFVDFFSTPDNTMWLQNDGNGNFTSHSLVPDDFSYRPYRPFTLGDLDSDGDIDLIDYNNSLSDPDGNEVYQGMIWLENDGSGGF